jgi:hypothetical protein
VLLVGESPPASGRHFYAANSGLYRAIRHAFVASQLLTDSEDVRDCFRDNGWLLRDLSPRPLNRLDDASRREAHRVGVVPLARAIRASCPEAIVVIVAGIGPHVRQAIQLAEWSGSYHEMPYPGRWVRARRCFSHQLGSFARAWFSALRGSEAEQHSPRPADSATRRWRRNGRVKTIQAAVSATEGAHSRAASR